MKKHTPLNRQDSFFENIEKRPIGRLRVNFLIGAWELSSVYMDDRRGRLGELLRRKIVFDTNTESLVISFVILTQTRLTENAK